MAVRQKQVKDQVIVITGASSGIGLATAKEAASRGARVVLNSRDPVDLSRAVQEIREDGGDCAMHIGDVADRSAMEGLADTAIAAYRRIDTWINNAGVSIYGEISEVRIEDARRLFDTNYWGVVNGSLVAVEHLETFGGTLINVGSVLSETAYPLQGHYAASKHAVKGFTDTLRIELEKKGAPIIVTLIQPAAIDTPYPEHARNYLPSDPKQEAPVYKPEVVADAILACAEKPHRNLRVGGVSKALHGDGESRARSCRQAEDELVRSADEQTAGAQRRRRCSRRSAAISQCAATTPVVSGEEVSTRRPRCTRWQRWPALPR